MRRQHDVEKYELSDVEKRDLMHKDGSIYMHCDWRMAAFIRRVW